MILNFIVDVVHKLFIATLPFMLIFSIVIAGVFMRNDGDFNICHAQGCDCCDK